MTRCLIGMALVSGAAFLAATGEALAYVLNGVLGVSRHDLEVEWESTFYPRLPEMKNRNGWNVKRHFDEGFAKYGADGGTWQRRIELYLLDCGVTEAEIAAFKSIMLE